MATKRCFVVMGYGTRLDISSGKRINLDRVYMEVIKPVVIGCGYECIRGDEVLDSGLIDESMYYGILESDLVVADVSTLNPNAIYELGVRHGVRRFHTIIMMETGDKFFFDLNHNRTLTYTFHRKKSLFDSEAERVRERLKGIIKSIEVKDQVDSPLYTYVNDLQEPQRAEAAKRRNRDSKPIFERISEASNLRRKEHYADAYVLFEALSKDIPSDPFFKQQMALCTYNQDDSSVELLDKAYSFLKPMEETVDPETNGLIGAIFKRRFEITYAQEDIDKAVQSYKKAYSIYTDNYNGENYAFCLMLAASICTDEEQKEELKILSRHIYREIFEANKDFAEEEINTDYEKWIIATLAASAKVLNKQDLYGKYEELFLSKADKMMKSSYRRQMERLIKLLNN